MEYIKEPNKTDKDDPYKELREELTTEAEKIVTTINKQEEEQGKDYRTYYHIIITKNVDSEEINGTIEFTRF